jgi:hypothetical protein
MSSKSLSTYHTGTSLDTYQREEERGRERGEIHGPLLTNRKEWPTTTISLLTLHSSLLTLHSACLLAFAACRLATFFTLTFSIGRLNGWLIADNLIYTTHKKATASQAVLFQHDYYGF